MANFQELTKFLRVNKIDTWKGNNLQSAQFMYPMYADSCDPGDVNQYDPAGRLEPTTATNRNLCASNHWEKYDVETMTLRPELYQTGLKAEHEDTMLGESIHGFVRQYGLSEVEDIRPVNGNFTDFLSMYAQGERSPNFSSFIVPPK